MKTPFILAVALLGFLTPLLQAAESENTAEFILTNPEQREGQQVTLDVAFVKPVRWKSPVPELAFFHALTMDRKDRKPGGGIIVAVLAAEAAAFTKKYGTDFEGRYEKDELVGTLLASPGRGPRRQVWFVDTSGLAAELIKQNKMNIEDEGKGAPEEQEGAGRPPRGPKHRGGPGAPEGGGAAQ